MARPSYTLEWYEDEHGDKPVLRWLREELTPQKRRAIGTAMNEILQYLGPEVVKGNFGDTLGGGLFEFRLDQDVKQILARKGKTPRKRDQQETGKLLLRVFCHAYGDWIVLLLGGYDKGERSSRNHQQEQIALARTRLKSWKSRQGRARRPS